MVSVPLMCQDVCPLSCNCGRLKAMWNVTVFFKVVQNVTFSGIFLLLIMSWLYKPIPTGFLLYLHMNLQSKILKSPQSNSHCVRIVLEDLQAHYVGNI